MDNRRIGLFDSGLGGLTVMKELMRLLPLESIVYFGDTGRIPYGTKSVETVIKYAKSDIKFLKTFDLKMIVAACGTASAIALPRLKQEDDIPILGVLEATAKTAAESTKNGRIGVIGTGGTVHSGAYQRALAKENEALSVVAVACPLFVPLVEHGFANKEAARLIAAEYLEPIKQSGADTLILGCTHYPLLRQVITEVLGGSVALINPGQCVARDIQKRLSAEEKLSQMPQPDQYRFYVSDDPAEFTSLGSLFLEQPIKGRIEQVDIEPYTEALASHE